MLNTFKLQNILVIAFVGLFFWNIYGHHVTAVAQMQVQQIESRLNMVSPATFANFESQLN